MDLGLLLGVVAIGVVHGVLPDHGWPIAATYALGRSRRYLAGAIAGLILGVGHLISSVALVAAYYWFSGFAAFAEGPWLRYVAGTALILLGIREYRHGGDHGHAHDANDHDHTHDETGHDEAGDDRTDGGYPGHDADGSHDHGGRDRSAHDGTAGSSGLRSRLPGGGHRHLDESDAERGLVALGTTALVLGFAHEEPIQILAICVGTAFCLELMLVYSLAVIVAILCPTLALIAGYEHHRETVETYTPYLPLLTAVVLVGMGLAFIIGVF